MKVWKTVQNMKELGTSIDRFWHALRTEFSRNCNQIYIADVVNGESEDTACGWACIYESEIYELRERRPNVPGQDPIFGALTIGVELWRDVCGETEWSCAHDPFIYVGFCLDHKDPWRKMKLNQYGKCIGDFGSGRVLPTGRSWPLWMWVGEQEDLEDAVEAAVSEGWNQRSWFFVLPLFSIHSPDNIRTEIVTPIQGLFNGDCPAEIFAGRNAIHPPDG